MSRKKKPKEKNKYIRQTVEFVRSLPVDRRDALIRMMGRPGKMDLHYATALAQGILTATEHERLLLLEDLASAQDIIDRTPKPGKYPWSNMEDDLSRRLAQGDPWETAKEEANRLYAELEEKGLQGMVSGDPQGSIRSLYSDALWIRSKRPVVHVSEPARNALFSVGDALISQGKVPARFRDLPGPGSAKLFEKGVMFYWEGLSTVTFAYSTGDLLAPKLFYAEYSLRNHAMEDSLTEEFRRKKHVYEEGLNIPRSFRAWGIRTSMPFVLNEEEVSKSWKEFAAEFAPYLQGNLSVEDLPYEVINGFKLYDMLFATINALAAMDNTYEIKVWRNAQDPDKKRRRGSRGSRNFRSILLDESGLWAWKKKYIDVDVVHPEEHDYPDHRKPPCLYSVDDHQAYMWVREETLLDGEQIYDIKENDSGTVLFKVRRSRKGGARGGKLEGAVSRMKVGVDDLNTEPT